MIFPCYHLYVFNTYCFSCNGFQIAIFFLHIIVLSNWDTLCASFIVSLNWAINTQSRHKRQFHSVSLALIQLELL